MLVALMQSFSQFLYYVVVYMMCLCDRVPLPLSEHLLVHAVHRLVSRRAACGHVRRAACQVGASCMQSSTAGCLSGRGQLNEVMYGGLLVR